MHYRSCSNVFVHTLYIIYLYLLKSIHCLRTEGGTLLLASKAQVRRSRNGSLTFTLSLFESAALPVVAVVKSDRFHLNPYDPSFNQKMSVSFDRQRDKQAASIIVRNRGVYLNDFLMAVHCRPFNILSITASI